MSTSPWVVLRLRNRAGAVRLDYADVKGRAFDCPYAAGDEPPEAIRTSIGELVGPHPIRLAIFLDPQPPGRGGAVLARLVQSLAYRRDQIRTVFLVPDRAVERGPFELPLDIITVGAATTWLRDAVASREWLRDIQKEDAGLTATGDWIRELLKRRWRGAETDMMICAATDLPRLTVALRAVGHPPRLLVSLTDAETAPRPPPFAPRRLPPGTSLLVLPFGGPLGDQSDALVELLRDVAHDLPLHELGRRTDRDDGASSRESVLFSRPEWLEALRLSHARSALTAEVLSLKSTGTPAGVANFLSDARPMDLKNIAEGSARVASSPLGGAYFDEAVKLMKTFTRGSDGLLPMANLRRALAAEREAETHLRSVAAQALRDPKLSKTYMDQQARTVDVTMRRLHPNGAAGPCVTNNEALVVQASYRIRVQIGWRSAVSIVSGDVPPIDLLLPPPEKGRHHVLHVALYTDDFDLASPILQRLDLPEIGPSPAIQFDVTPRRGVAIAQARIAIYYDLPPQTADGEMRNHLVQTFLLTAHVRQSEDQPVAAGGVAVELEFSLNPRFSQLERLEPRLVSLALNDGPGPASHKLMMKRGADALPVNFTEAQIAGSLKNIRDAFTWASRNDTESGPRFPADQDEGAVGDFDQVIWRLARAGRSLYRELFGVALGSPLVAALSAAARERDKLIQVVHLVRNFAFPWTSIYDFDLPLDIVGAAAPTICKDFRRNKPDGTPYSCAECLDNCTYPDKTRAVCVYGFWGTRNQVEQLIADKTEKPQALKPVGPGAVAVSMGLDGRFIDEIPRDLQQKLGHFVRQFSGSETFLPELWTDRRPAILLLVGHYRTQDVPGEPAGPRLTLAAQRFLRPDDIFQQSGLHPENWTDPRSVILLAACSGGVVDITSVQNFVNIFIGVGAGAVVGPEAVIYEGVARRFAVEMSEALVAGASVGDAMLAFRRRLLQNLNPLGLVFTAYGFADLASPHATD